MIYTTDTNDFLGALRRLFDRGEITLPQYAESLRRSRDLQKATVDDTKYRLDSSDPPSGVFSQLGIDYVGGPHALPTM